jgi:hypothetical protein
MLKHCLDCLLAAGDSAKLDGWKFAELGLPAALEMFALAQLAIMKYRI